MKEFLRKTSYLFVLTLVIVFGAVSILQVSAEEILKKFNAVSTNYETPIDFLGNFHIIKTTTGKHVYCMQYDLLSPDKNILYTKDSLITDNGLNYILNTAYNTKTDNDHYIYKSALWIYMIDKGLMAGDTSRVKDYYKNVGNSNTIEAKKILELVSAAKKAGKNDTVAPTLTVTSEKGSFTLDETGKYYLSPLVKVESSTGKYEVELTNTKGAEVVKEKTGFKIKVDASKVTDLSVMYGYKVTNSKDIYVSYKYLPDNSKYQPLAVTFKQPKSNLAEGKYGFDKDTTVEFVKVDANDNSLLEGAKLELKDSKGNVVKTWISTKASYKLDNLTAGTYTLTELEAPAGYTKTNEVIKFTIDKLGKLLDDNNKEITKVVIKNKKITYSVPIQKIDNKTNELLSGAELELKDSTGKVLETWTSTKEEKVIHSLVPGKYTITEKEAPAGYNKLENSIEFTINKDGKIIFNNKEVTIIKVLNEKKLGGVLISKRDITNDEELPGATLTIKDSNGNTKDEWTWVSGTEAHYIEALEPGTYTLHEVYAPEGYILSDETVTFTVKADGEVETVIMYNEPAPKDEIEVEPTSSFKNIFTTLFGSLVVVAGSTMIVKTTKRKED